jgi:hypothetical protein
MVRRSLDIKPIWREELTQITSNDPLNTEVSEIISLLGAVFTPTTMFEPSVASDSPDTFTPTKSNNLSLVTSQDVTPEQDKENNNINQKQEILVSASRDYSLNLLFNSLTSSDPHSLSHSITDVLIFTLSC